MRHLITGSTGDVGSILYKLYKKDDFNISPFDERIDIEADRILHLAAKSPPANSEEIIKSNITYLQSVVDFATRNKISEFIFFSAISVFGKQNKENVDENDCIIEPDIYSVSKLLGEKILSESLLNVLCLRLPAVLGFKNKTNFLSRCYIKLKNNEDIELTNPHRLFNNFISIENIFNFIKYIKIKRKFDIVNLASRKEMTILAIVEVMKKTMNSTSDISILGNNSSFFNISTEMAESEYGFIPCSAKNTITRWIQQREGYEIFRDSSHNDGSTSIKTNIL